MQNLQRKKVNNDKTNTLWFKSKWREFNHIEKGHSHKGTPYANCEYQKQAWGNVIWWKEWNYLESYDADEIPKASIQYGSEA